MGYLDLINALRDKGEEKAATLWLHVEAEAQRIRTEAMNRIEAAKGEQARAQARKQAALTRGIRMEAERTARELWSAAKSRLADRCAALARESLADLRNPDDGGSLQALAEELPREAWEEVRVHPVDRDRAAGLFPGARVVADPSITGGLEVIGRQGRLRVCNTLDKRLERGWPDLLPTIVRTIEDEVTGDEPSA